MFLCYLPKYPISSYKRYINKLWDSSSISFCIYLIPGIFRIPSLRNKKKNSECLYNISKIIQII